MLVEYALIPDIFDANCYDYPELCSSRIEYIKDVLLEEALVRDLRNGDWCKYFETYLKKNGDSWPQRSKEIIKKLIKQNRLRRVPAAQATTPSNYLEWCYEAISSHEQQPLTGVITTQSNATAVSKPDIVASIDKLSGADWWRKRSPSIRLYRTTNDYLRHLQLLFCNANSIMFIDPYIDPMKDGYNNVNNDGYREFNQLLTAIKNPDEPPVIEIHLCHLEDAITPRQYEANFRSKLSGVINKGGLTVEVFIWDNFHDRYLISNLIGINLPHGFGISDPDTPNPITTWTRLGRKDRDDIQREFDPASGRHKLQHRFTVS
ncbi:hypothetical protein IQ231_01765 [Cuspidothrix issatschenkoi LEGE 03284]|uniref:hypothetical protein n=1 Tax=Cuspidothrix issatschenkoi TaxID=230752 RepID=UPI001881D86B|nr:hypothetical protein [Cuspidothrix issatschenkoi]MBE9230452.1 hypothetical protein [Cuspidothrix issatschenkoi LEGE 03284]